MHPSEMIIFCDHSTRGNTKSGSRSGKTRTAGVAADGFFRLYTLCALQRRGTARVSSEGVRVRQ